MSKSRPLIERGDSADSVRLADVRASQGGWDFTNWLAVVDYLSWWPRRDSPVGGRPLGSPRVTYREVYEAKYGFSLEAMHAKRVGTYGEPGAKGAS